MVRTFWSIRFIDLCRLYMGKQILDSKKKIDFEIGSQIEDVRFVKNCAISIDTRKLMLRSAVLIK